jgi:hypothetical protein
MKQTKFWDSEIAEKIRVLSEKTSQIALTTWAADCAEHVLHYFIRESPTDRRPEKAIAAARERVQGRGSVSQSRRAAFEAHSAARTATSVSAREAARSAGHAAATAHVSGHALHAATYAVKAVFYASCIKDVEKNITEERFWQYERLLAYSQSSV